MRWSSLGHAGWLVETSQLRILCDPLLGDLLHGGIHRVFPPRDVHIEALRPDLLVISHAHPDHFDVPSLALLLRANPDLPVLTADPLVCRTAYKLGARTASLLSARQALDLGAVTLLTTPSRGVTDEWGLVVADQTGIAWNQVDSVLHPSDVRAVRQGLRALLGNDHLDLTLVHWCPLREVQTATCADLGFPFEAWAEKLLAIAALETKLAVPSAAGFRHVPPFDWRDAHVFPVSEAALARDLAVLAPQTRVLSLEPGGYVEFEQGGSSHGRDDAICTCRAAPPPVPFAPLSVPKVNDPALDGQSTAHIRAIIDPWLEGSLRTAIAREAPLLRIMRPLRLALEIVLPDERDVHLFIADGHSVSHTRTRDIDPEYDTAVVIAGSMLADVITGRRHWGEPLLAGLLRGVNRVRPMPAFFLYWALSYRESVERSVDDQVERIAR